VETALRRRSATISLAHRSINVNYVAYAPFTAEALKGTLVSDGKRLEIRHFCFAACGSSIRQEVFAGPKSLLRLA
jgi:hypothetical protein